MMKEWEYEPDFLEYKDQNTGYKCYIKRNKVGALCGYVVAKKPELFINKETWEIGFEIHGNVTFNDFVENKQNQKEYLVGFDCAHMGDVVPTLYELQVFYEPVESYKNIQYVIKECSKLAKQIKKLEDENE